MNILHLLSWFPTSNHPLNGNFCLKHIAAVSNKVHSVVLSVMADMEISSERRVEIKEYSNFKHIYIHVKANHGLCSRLVNKIRIFNGYNWGLKYVKAHFFTPDMVHLHVTFPAGEIACYWKKRFQLPYLLTEHWSIFHPLNHDQMTGFIRYVIRHIANHAECILPVSADLQHNMQRYGISVPFKVIPNVVNMEIFKPEEKPAPKEDVKHILHISNLRDEAKNFSGILRVIKKLSEKREDFVLDVVHDDSKPEFEKFVVENRLERFVIFHGQKTERELTHFYAAADFFLLFSNFENLPCVLIESFACGLPVVTTGVGGICEIVDESRGKIVPSGNEQALLQAVDFMLDHCQEFNSADIRQYAAAHFSQEVVGRMICEVYGKIKSKGNSTCQSHI